MLIDLLNQDYPNKSIDQNQSRLINMYLEPDKSKGKYQLAAFPTPGLTLFCDTSQANVRALLEYNGIVYVVSGNKFGSINSGGTFTQLGSNLNTSSGYAKILSITGGSDLNNQVMIIDGTNGYTYNIDTAVATFPIVDVDFPQTATDMTSQDDYILVANNNSIQYNLSNLADTTTWAALDFASKISKPDNIVAIKSNQERVWIFGNSTTEIWWNSGNADFPFEKIGDTFIHKGCASKQSVCMANEQLYMLGQSQNGGYQFLQFVGYSPSSIGNPGIDYKLNTYNTVSDCVSYAYIRDGHEFIDNTFPTQNITHTYDVNTGVWIERQSDSGGGTYGKFLASSHCFCYNKSLVGDSTSGKIYSQSTSVYTENGTPIRRMFISPPIYKEGRRIFISRLLIDVETNIGANKTFLLEASNDGGRSWDSIQTFTVPTTPGEQLYTSSLGSAFNWMFRITTTMDAKFCLLGFQAEISFGNN